jgi:MoxR-like ATPase
LAATTATVPTPNALYRAIERAVSTVVAVPAPILETMLCAVLARGHVLLEGNPGIGKTLLARTFAQCIDCDFRRIQFTNDLMPSDIVGTSIWRPASDSFTFVPGPLFANLVLADEINRTSPRTLSCLLEAMESGRVSIDGRAHELGSPFLVLATRNPIEFHGTYPVPEAALDRFLAQIQHRKRRSIPAATPRQHSPKCAPFCRASSWSPRKVRLARSWCVNRSRTTSCVWSAPPANIRAQRLAQALARR